jgi:hypothetical protein
LPSFLQKLEAQGIPRPCKELTADGQVIDGLFNYPADEGALTAAMLKGAARLLGHLSPEKKATTVIDSVDDDLMRIWSNPEFHVNPGKAPAHPCPDIF